LDDDEAANIVAVTARYSIRILAAHGGVERELPNNGRLVIGRSRSADISVNDGGISRQHAILHVGEALSLEDLGSHNGTRLFSSATTIASADSGGTAEQNARPLMPKETVKLDVGSVFQLGQTLFVIERSGEKQPDVVIEEPAMKELWQMAERVARGTISVLITGETGVGKEHLAEHLVKRSLRSDAPFLRLNCAAFTDSLLEAELFGYERGAFTGATKAKVGLLEAANGGTVFLDEVGEMPLTTQAKLLRVLESHQLLRVGGLEPRKIDVRFLSATNRKLREQVDRGVFREDLFFRLNGVELMVPPLRERPSEIEPLARAFVERAARSIGQPAPSLDPAVLSALRAHSFRGNIRELKNTMERAVLLTIGPMIKLEHLPEEYREPRSESPTQGDDLRGQVAELERAHVLAVLEECGNNQTLAAKRLGISRTTLSTRLDAWGVDRPRKK
jgi:two-component system, NtrC family, response regulator AtoC